MNIKKYAGVTIVSLILAQLTPSTARAGGWPGYTSFNVGNISAKIANNGLIGDSSNVLPSGWYPSRTKNSYFKTAGLWIGASLDNGVSYGVSSTYPPEFYPTADCSTMVSAHPGARAVQELRARFDDTNPAYNSGKILGTKVTMQGYQWSFPPVDNFYITQYTVKNNNVQKLTGLYAGLFCDGDVATATVSSRNNDYTGFDRTVDDSTGKPRNMIWMTGDSISSQTVLGFPVGYIGIRLLEARKPSGDTMPSQGFFSAKSWNQGVPDPASDANPLNLYNRYGYLSSRYTDADAQRVPNDARITTDSLHLQIPDYLINEIEGVYKASDNLHLGINYFIGGSFNAAGWITLGQPAPDSIVRRSDDVTINFAYNAAYDTVLAVQVAGIPLYSVVGVWLPFDTLHLGINYYTGGSFTPDGWITLGTTIDAALLGSDFPIASYSNKANNVTVCYNYRHRNESDYPTDVNNVSVIWVAHFDEVQGVYLGSDTLHAGTNYYTGGSFNKTTGAIALGTALPDLNPVWVCYRTFSTYNYRMLLNSGPYTLMSNDSINLVFATVAGQTLAELRKNSDWAQYMWDHPGYSPSSGFGSLSGRIVRTDSITGIENAVIRAYQAGAVLDSAWSAVDGSYTLNSLTAGTYDSLTASKADYADGRDTTTVTVSGGRDTTGFVIVLPGQFAQISGRIIRTDGITPVPGASVQLSGSQSATVMTGADGRYSISPLGAASADTIVATLAGFQQQTVPNVSLTNDSVTVVNMHLPCLSSEITGHITRIDGATPIANATVRVDSAGKVGVASVTSGADGSYDVTSLPAGNYKIVVTATWFQGDSSLGIVNKIDSISRVNFALGQGTASGSMKWIYKTSMPSARFAMGAAKAGGKVYIIGGKDYNDVLSSVAIYDPAADTAGGTPWAAGSPMPTARYGVSCVAIGDSVIYAVGGYDASGTALNVVETYHRSSDAWQTGFPAMPTPRAFLGLAALHDTIYASGGENGAIAGLDTVEAYSISANTWSTKKSLLGGSNNGRTGLASVACDSAGIYRIYAVGGRNVNGSYMINNQKYIPATNAWVSRAALPGSARAFLSCDIAFDSIYCLGGRDAGSYYSNVVSYNPYGNNWKNESPMQDSRAYLSVVAFEGDGIYAIGGRPDVVQILGSVEKGYRYGSVSGTASTTVAGPVSGLTVDALLNGEVKNSEMTGAAGNYTLTGLEPGDYQIRFHKPAVIDSTVANVSVQWGKNTALDFTGVAGGKPSAKSPIFALQQSYPNPFHGQSTIRYQLPSWQPVELTVYNVLGQRVKTLASGMQAAGWHTVNWSGENDRGQRVAGGIYLYRLSAGTNVATKKLVLVH